MIVDERQHIRELGYRRILEARNQQPTGKSVRTFMYPSIDFGATDHSELLEWTKCKLLSPTPVLESLTTENISSFLQNNTA